MMGNAMSQNELQKLLYAALASDSENAQHNARDQDSQAENAAADLSYCTPAEIIAHYDFRARASSQPR